MEYANDIYGIWTYMVCIWHTIGIFFWNMRYHEIIPSLDIVDMAGHWEFPSKWRFKKLGKSSK
jgi:hypothetical protein